MLSRPFALFGVTNCTLPNTNASKCSPFSVVCKTQTHIHHLMSVSKESIKKMLRRTTTKTHRHSDQMMCGDDGSLLLCYMCRRMLTFMRMKMNARFSGRCPSTFQIQHEREAQRNRCRNALSSCNTLMCLVSVNKIVCMLSFK